MRTAAALIIVIIAIVVLFFLAVSRAPDMLANNLSKKLGVSVSIDSMNFSPSKIELNHIEIGNPRGYTLPKAFSAEEIELHAPVTTYFKDSIVIEKIDVDNIYLGLEFDSPTGSDGNWKKIFQNYQKQAKDTEKENKKILIKKLVFTNIQTDLLFRNEPGNVRKLPTISRIELNNISTEGDFPTDQLMSTILGQMVKEVFIQQNLNELIPGIIKEPGKAVDKILEPFKGIFNATPSTTKELELTA